MPSGEHALERDGAELVRQGPFGRKWVILRLVLDIGGVFLKCALWAVLRISTVYTLALFPLHCSGPECGQSRCRADRACVCLNSCMFASSSVLAWERVCALELCVCAVLCFGSASVAARGTIARVAVDGRRGGGGK